MNSKILLIVLGEPYSTFSEIIAKYLSTKKNLKKKIILIGNVKLFNDQIKKLKYKIELNKINEIKKAEKKVVNIIDISFKYKKIFDKISYKSSKYIENCFKKSLEIIKSNKKNVILINGPISKKYFLKKKYLGITEFLSKKTYSKNEVMLIYNNNISVSPLTTHIPIKYVNKYISKKKITNNVIALNKFYKNQLNLRAKFAILGLNPHCETIDKISEEEKIIIPAIKILKKRGIDVNGPFATDTFFLKKNLMKYNVVIGMYHDQVLTPIKTLYSFNAINVTVGLPFIRISPDHGPNAAMLGKNKSDPSSFSYAMKFVEKLK